MLVVHRDDPQPGGSVVLEGGGGVLLRPPRKGLPHKRRGDEEGEGEDHIRNVLHPDRCTDSVISRLYTGDASLRSGN